MASCSSTTVTTSAVKSLSFPMKSYKPECWPEKEELVISPCDEEQLLKFNKEKLLPIATEVNKLYRLARERFTSWPPPVEFNERTVVEFWENLRDFLKKVYDKLPSDVKKQFPPFSKWTFGKSGELLSRIMTAAKGLGPPIMSYKSECWPEKEELVISPRDEEQLLQFNRENLLPTALEVRKLYEISREHFASWPASVAFDERTVIEFWENLSDFLKKVYRNLPDDIRRLLTPPPLWTFGESYAILSEITTTLYGVSLAKCLGLPFVNQVLSDRQSMRECLSDRLDKLTKMARYVGQVVRVPEGGLYCFPDVLTRVDGVKMLSVGAQVSSVSSVLSMPDQLGALTSLRLLTLRKCGMKEISSSLGSLVHLQRLDLSENKIREFPTQDMVDIDGDFVSVGCLHTLRRLRVLILSENRLKYLPASLGRLSDLKQLDVSNNRISSLEDDQIDALTTQMKGLCVSTSHVLKLRSLNKLHLAGNDIPSLPSKISKLRSLELLDLSGNFLSVVHESCGKLTTLRTCLLANNRLMTCSFPDTFFSLPLLEVLNIAKNAIVELPKAIGNATALCELNVGGNKLYNLPDVFLRLTNLRRLYVHKNPLTTLPPSLLGLQSLTFVRVPTDCVAVVKASAGAKTFTVSSHKEHQSQTETSSSSSSSQDSPRLPSTLAATRERFVLGDWK